MATYLLIGRTDCLGNLEIEIPEREKIMHDAQLSFSSGSRKDSDLLGSVEDA